MRLRRKAKHAPVQTGAGTATWGTVTVAAQQQPAPVIHAVRAGDAAADRSAA